MVAREFEKSSASNIQDYVKLSPLLTVSNQYVYVALQSLPFPVTYPKTHSFLRINTAFTPLFCLKWSNNQWNVVGRWTATVEV